MIRFLHRSIFLAAWLLPLSILTASDSSAGIALEASCWIGCDAHYKVDPGGDPIRELLMTVDLSVSGDLFPLSPPSPVSPIGKSWFLGGWGADVTVVFDIGNGFSPIVMSDPFVYSYRNFAVDVGVDITQAGTFFPTVRAFGTFENRYRDGWGYGFSEQSQFDQSWTFSPITISAVPGPVVGAGFPSLLMAIAGFIGWRRSRRSIAA